MSQDSADPQITRFGVSIGSSLLSRFDELIGSQGYTNRSEAIRDLVRDRLVEADWDEEEGSVVGVAALVYDHDMRQVGERLTTIQHDIGHLVVSTLHVHLDERDCLEVVVLRGPGARVRELSNRLLSLKGVKHGRLLMTGTAE
ncbi:nickel-responsive transcriptional regulator NikR [Candidatus Latescibacterota bacterium]